MVRSTFRICSQIEPDPTEENNTDSQERLASHPSFDTSQ